VRICDCCEKIGKVCCTTGQDCPGGLELCDEHAEQLKSALQLVESLFRSKPPGYVPTEQERENWVQRIIPRPRSKT
jgi:hypothetical protein